ncbi:MAG TPA: hypothetical protein VFF69_06340, partial [Phycisphaerales bacterium]|nr:hypothetical protein [Phycisphaerales bacterium]
NQGLTIARWGSVRRSDDPGTGTTHGVLPAYCLESKSQTGGAANRITRDLSRPDNLHIRDFRPEQGYDTLEEAITEQSNTDNEIVPTIVQEPKDKSGLEIEANLAGVPYEGDANNVPLSIETHLSEITTARVADMLLPLGIGPQHAPSYLDEDDAWTTLSEALAIALYYENPTVGVYAGAFVPPPTLGQTEVLLDRGSLQYDKFVPFYDTGADGMFNPDDRRWGLGVPLAAGLIDAFTSLPREFGSLRSPTHGQVNVNTVSREAARSLPGFSPPPNTGSDGTADWWWSTPMHNWNSDIATTLVAYRDRLAIHPRDVTGGEPVTSLLNFRDWWDVDGNNVPQTRAAPNNKSATPPGEDPADNARWGTTDVAAIREEPGMRSLGELLFLRDLEYVTSNLGYPSPHDIDRLGFDGDDIDTEGIDSVRYDTTDPPDGIPDAGDGVEDDYDERLALANSVIASSSVRSDVFAVWFVVHGYQESDTTGLTENDPLIPTIARRFVMVVDRSNVTQPGEKPKIVLFKEVPL